MTFLSRLFRRNSPAESNIERALKAASKTNSGTARKELHKALARQRLIIPIQREPENLKRDELGRVLETAQLEFIGYRDRSGKRFLALFTNPDAIKKWTAESPHWIAIDTPSICVMAVESGYSAIRINPGSPESAELNADEIESIAQEFPVEPS